MNIIPFKKQKILPGNTQRKWSSITTSRQDLGAKRDSHIVTLWKQNKTKQQIKTKQQQTNKQTKTGIIMKKISLGKLITKCSILKNKCMVIWKEKKT